MQNQIAVIGLGYVGLPLAVEFSKKFSVIGFDINQKRVDELNKGKDSTREVDDHNLKSVLVDSVQKLDGKGLYCTTAMGDIASANIYIITVPTPTDKHNRPDLTPLIKSSSTVGKV
ncbi:MAG TPA: hypothetical protein VK921_05435, partial [Anditalea sp.]|nr:hypothetical protein [Anditalea sp.]